MVNSALNFVELLIVVKCVSLLEPLYVTDHVNFYIYLESFMQILTYTVGPASVIRLLFRIGLRSLHYNTS
jgi:hypothetical protein